MIILVNLSEIITPLSQSWQTFDLCFFICLFFSPVICVLTNGPMNGGVDDKNRDNRNKSRNSFNVAKSLSDCMSWLLLLLPIDINKVLSHGKNFKIRKQRLSFMIPPKKTTAYFNSVYKSKSVCTSPFTIPKYSCLQKRLMISWLPGNSSLNGLPGTKDCFLRGRTCTRQLPQAQTDHIHWQGSKFPNKIPTQLSILHTSWETLKVELCISKACFYLQSLYLQQPWFCYSAFHPPAKLSRCK